MTTSESRGYSTVLVARVQTMDKRLATVRLALACFKHNLPVMSVAKTIGVSRATIYSWFKGEAFPRKGYVEKIEGLLSRLD